VNPTFPELLGLAVAEHHRTHMATEWFHLKNLRASRGGNLPDDPGNLRLKNFLVEFGLARGLDSAKGTQSVRSALEQLSKADGISKLPENQVNAAFCQVETSLVKAGDEENGARRRFISGATKVTWFAFGHNYPMLDRYTMAALRGVGRLGERPKGGNAELWEFKRRLCLIDYCEARNVTKAFLESSREFVAMDWASSERTLDKLLWLVGLGKQRESAFRWPAYQDYCNKYGLAKALAPERLSHWSNGLPCKFRSHLLGRIAKT